MARAHIGHSATALIYNTSLRAGSHTLTWAEVNSCHYQVAGACTSCMSCRQPYNEEMQCFQGEVKATYFNSWILVWPQKLHIKLQGIQRAVLSKFLHVDIWTRLAWTPSALTLVDSYVCGCHIPSHCVWAVWPFIPTSSLGWIQLYCHCAWFEIHKYSVHNIISIHTVCTT